MEFVREASGLFHATLGFQFIICFLVTSKCLEVTRPLTKQLQSSTFDVVTSKKNVTLLYIALRRLQAEIDIRHEEWYDLALNLADSINVEPARPRTANKQANRDNTPSNSVSHYCKRVVPVPFLDYLASQIQSRFSDRNMAVLNGFYAFPDKVTSEVDWRPNFERYLEEITDDLPEPHYLKTELDMWEDYCRHEKGTPPSTLSALLPKVDRIAFPNVFTAFQILATIPVTTCSCERSISVLRRLKTYLWNTLSQGRLNGLAMLHVHRDINLDVKEVIDCFCAKTS